MNWSALKNSFLYGTFTVAYVFAKTVLISLLKPHFAYSNYDFISQN